MFASTYHVNFVFQDKQNGIGQDVVSQQSVQLRYSYDALQRPSSVELSSGGSGGSLMTVKYAYLSGSAAERTTPLIASLNTSVNGRHAIDLEYSYDALGNITKISGHTLSGSDTANYRYDAQSQLTREALSDRSYSYTYDTAGNILSKKETRGGTTTHTYTYGNSQWKDLLTKYDGVTITYDAIGNPLNYRGMTFTWANGRELRSASAGGAYMLYTYGVDGLRTQKIVGANEIHSYGWSGGRLVYERVGASAYSTMGTGSTQGTQSAQKVLTPPAASAYDRTLYFLYDAGGSPIGFILLEGSRMPAIYYYVKNLQGDVLGIIDSGGNVKAAYRYNAWGELLSATGELAELNPIRYRGYYYDSETGLYYLQSRYYDPEIGRFINADSLLDMRSVRGYNLFAYCLNNPVSTIDSSGEIAISAFVVGAGVLLGGAIIGALMANDPNLKKATAGMLGDARNTFINWFGSTPASPFPDPNRNDRDSKNYTAHNFRKNLQEYTGQSGEGMDAHHVLPQYFESQFDAAGINIHEPQYGTWVEKSLHNSWSYEYDLDWYYFFDGAQNPSKDAILSFGRALASKYGFPAYF